MKISKVIKIVVSVCIVACIVGGYVYSATAPVSYRANRVVRGNLAGTVKESGNVRGNSEKVYYAKVSAPVAVFNLKEGDLIKKGDKLLSYNTDELTHALTQASLGAKEAQENADGAIAKSDKYAGKYAKAAADDAAYAALYAYEREQGNAIDESQYAQDYQKACDYASVSKQLAAKQGEISAKQTEIAKYTDGFGGKLTDDYELDSSGNASINKSSKDYKKYKELKEELGELNDEYYSLQKSLAGFDETTYTPDEYASLHDTQNVMEDITRNWTEAKSDKATAESAILNAEQKAALQSAADRYADTEALAQERLKKAEDGVVSEFNGVITSTSVKTDAFVQEGTPLFTVESCEDLKVELMVSKYDIGNIEIGQEATINIAGNKYSGKVSRINHVATSDSSDKNKIMVDVVFDEPDDKAIIGVEADVTISTQKSENAILIPYSAYYSDDSGSYVYCTVDGKLARKDIEHGIITDEYVEVLSGLNENELVIVDAVAQKSIGTKAVSVEE